MTNPLNNEVTDSRDLIEYREFLEQEILEHYIDWVEVHNEDCDEGSELEIPEDFESIEFVDEEAFTQTCEDLIVEYAEIKDFCEELSDYAVDFEHGEGIIHEDYFEEYCKELVYDCGYLSDDLPSFIESNIDWGRVADDLEVDYTRVSFDGSEYLIR